MAYEDRRAAMPSSAPGYRSRGNGALAPQRVQPQPRPRYPDPYAPPPPSKPPPRRRPARKPAPPPRRAVAVHTRPLTVLQVLRWLGAIGAVLGIMYMIVSRDARIAELHRENQRITTQMLLLREQQELALVNTATSQSMAALMAQAQEMALPTQEQERSFSVAEPTAAPPDPTPPPTTWALPAWLRRIFG